MPQVGKITQEEVNAICARIHAQGKRPSTRQIRAEHGAGSTGTIQAMLRVWEANNPQPETNVVLTTALQKSLQDNLGYEVARAKQELNERLEIAAETINDLTRENDQLALENAALEAASGDLMDTLAAYKGQVQQLEAEIVEAKAAAQRERQEAEQLRTTLTKAQLRLELVDELEAEHTALQRNLDQARAGQVEAERLASVAAAQRDAHADRVVEEKARSEKLAGQVDLLTQELSKAAVRVEAAQGRYEMLSIETNVSKEDAKKARATAAEARQAEAEWRGHADALRAQLATLTAPLAQTNVTKL